MRFSCRRPKSEKIFPNSEADFRINTSAPESWNQIVGLRNTIAHGYERVNLSDVWRYLVEDLDELRASLVAARSEGWFELSGSES
jgi:uncharacterized protein with HEPN domain